jgi:hypothetical protein
MKKGGLSRVLGCGCQCFASCNFVVYKEAMPTDGEEDIGITLFLL